MSRRRPSSITVSRRPEAQFVSIGRELTLSTLLDFGNIAPSSCKWI